MKQVATNPVLPQQKMDWTNQNFGNDGIQFMQGTSRIIYDTLPIDGRTQFDFFRGVNARDFPFTNVGGSGTGLEAGESIVMARAYFTVLVISTVGTPDITSISQLDPAVLPNMAAGDISFSFGNSRVIKEMSALSFQPEFNKNAAWGDYQNFEFDTQLVLPPLQQFVASLRVSVQPAVLDTYIRLTIEGPGAILSAKTNY